MFLLIDNIINFVRQVAALLCTQSLKFVCSQLTSEDTSTQFLQLSRNKALVRLLSLQIRFRYSLHVSALLSKLSYFQNVYRYKLLGNFEHDRKYRVYEHPTSASIQTEMDNEKTHSISFSSKFVFSNFERNFVVLLSLSIICQQGLVKIVNDPINHLVSDYVSVWVRLCPQQPKFFSFQLAVLLRCPTPRR